MSTASEFYYRHILLYRELVTEEELRSCTEVQNEARAQGVDEPPVIDLLLEKGYLSHSQLDRINDEINLMREGGSTPDAIGPRIPGYQVRQLEGENATGSTFEAFQKSLRRAVSVKVLNSEFLTDRRSVEKYYLEAAAAANAGHPNIVQMIDLGFDFTGALYMVRERVEGESVQAMLERLGKIAPDEAAQLVLGVARGLAYIHRIGLVHGHIRPSNILVPPDKIAKLQDLGVSSSVPDDPRVSGKRRILGNPLYMAPEQIRGGAAIGPSADVYALGATFYAMVTGSPPFVADTPKEVFDMHIGVPPKPPNQVNPAVPADLARIILKMLAKNPEERYAKSEALCSDLENYVRRRSVLATSTAAMKAVTVPPAAATPAPAAAAVATPAPAGSSGNALWAILGVSVAANLARLAVYLLRG
jgi:serine/threonine-protein kinase